MKNINAEFLTPWQCLSETLFWYCNHEKGKRILSITIARTQNNLYYTNIYHMEKMITTVTTSCLEDAMEIVLHLDYDLIYNLATMDRE